jgi:aspartate aminotransferase-like enzyme
LNNALLSLSQDKRTAGSTISINSMQVLDLSLEHILAHGQRHYDDCRSFSNILRENLQESGLEVIGEGLSNTVTGVRFPFTIDPSIAEDKIGVYLGGGFSPNDTNLLRIANYSCVNPIGPIQLADKLKELLL